MASHNFDDTLIRILEEEVEKERWKKKLRIAGIVTNKRLTKKGSFMLTVKTKRSEYDIVVPKHRKNEFELTKNIYDGDLIKAVGERNINAVFCDAIEKLNKNTIKEKQIKLFA